MLKTIFFSEKQLEPKWGEWTIKVCKNLLPKSPKRKTNANNTTT
jgi:hypothetical protein